MLKYLTASKRKISEDVDTDAESTELDSTNSENQDVAHPTKKYKDKFQTRWLSQYTWLKYCSETDVMTCSFCNDFSSKCFKTSILTKHASSTAHNRQQKSALQAENNRKYMLTATDNAFKKADAENMALIKTAYFIAQNVSIFFFSISLMYYLLMYLWKLICLTYSPGWDKSNYRDPNLKILFKVHPNPKSE